MSDNYLLLNDSDDGIRTITFNRPELHNAFDDQFIHQLQNILDESQQNDAVRVVVLAANGKSFSAGADLNWMRRMASYSQQENLADAKALATLLQTLNHLNKPTLALVQGAAFGGGVGLVACCDIVLATPQASFCFSEVKIGLVPAVISPYVIATIGEKSARRYFLTAERFFAEAAKQCHLVDEIVAMEALSQRGQELCQQLCNNGPQALATAKQLIQHVAQKDDTVFDYTAQCIADIRVSTEGQEGLSAFLAKRQPQWKTKAC